MKWIYDHLEYFFLSLLIIGAGFLSLNKNPAIAKNAYIKELFDSSRVHRIEISLADSDLEKILENPTEKIKYHADIKIDGKVIEDASISTRGNATLFSAASLDDFSTYSYKINFQKWRKNSSYFDLDSFYLNNFYSDPSYLKDYLAFDLMRSAGVAAPLASFAEVYLNGSLSGFYLAIEGYDKSYLARTDNDPRAALLKPEPLANDNSRLNSLASDSPEEASLIIRDVYSEDYDSGGADLKYRDDNPASYPAIFDNSLTKLTPRDKTVILSALKSLNDTNFSEYWDVDSLVKYLVVHNTIVNEDSYIGLIPHNYVLKLSRGKLSLLPWDYDIGYCINWASESYPTLEDVAKIPLDSPLIRRPEIDRPLWTALINDPVFREKYHTVARSLLSKEILSGNFSEKLTQTRTLIYNYVLEDPGRRTDMAEFEASVDYLEDFLTLRAQYLLDELNGNELLTSLDLRSVPSEL